MTRLSIIMESSIQGFLARTSLLRETGTISIVVFLWFLYLNIWIALI